LIDLRLGEVIYRADQRIDHVYFPESAAVAMIDKVEDGRTVEVGIIGHEGMVGINIFLGCLVTPDKAIVQIAGSAIRMKTDDLRKELRFGSPLQRLLLRYTQSLLAVISQSVACSQHHTVAQRLSRWLLTMHDHAESNQFVMTQESIAAMLGVRRSGVLSIHKKAVRRSADRGTWVRKRGFGRQHQKRKSQLVWMALLKSIGG
jgi:CRP-like cAMP-binding protein